MSEMAHFWISAVLGDLVLMLRLPMGRQQLPVPSTACPGCAALTGLCSGDTRDGAEQFSATVSPLLGQSIRAGMF